MRPDYAHPDGLETIAQIRHEAPGTKIIAISGGDLAINADGLASALQTGADEVFVKPFHPQDLLERVSGALMG